MQICKSDGRVPLRILETIWLSFRTKFCIKLLQNVGKITYSCKNNNIYKEINFEHMSGHRGPIYLQTKVTKPILINVVSRPFLMNVFPETPFQRLRATSTWSVHGGVGP